MLITTVLVYRTFATPLQDKTVAIEFAVRGEAIEPAVQTINVCQVLRRDSVQIRTSLQSEAETIVVIADDISIKLHIFDTIADFLRGKDSVKVLWMNSCHEICSSVMKHLFSTGEKSSKVEWMAILKMINQELPKTNSVHEDILRECYNRRVRNISVNHAHELSILASLPQSLRSHRQIALAKADNARRLEAENERRENIFKVHHQALEEVLQRVKHLVE